MPDGLANPQFEEVFAAFKEHYGLYCNEKTRPYDGVMELLRGLKREGYQLAIVSNKPDFAVKELAEIYFEGIIAAATGEKEGVAKKPAPDTVRAALGELGVDAERVYRAFTKKSDILNSYIVPEYEVLHTQSREYIVDDLLTVMKERGVEV